MALGAFTVSASETVNVNDGETFECSSVPGSNAATDFNVYASRIICSGTCTVKLTAGGTSPAFRPRFILNDAAALTIDLSDLDSTSATLTFNGGFECGTGTSITIKYSRGNIRFGRSTGGVLSFAVLDADSISFVDASGSPIPGGIAFAAKTASLLIRVPQGVTRTAEAGCVIWAYGENTLNWLPSYEDGIYVSGFKLMDFRKGAVPAGKTVHVGAGGTFSVFNAITNSAATSVTYDGDWTFPNDVSLDDPTATFAIESHHAGDVTGTVSGSGSVTMSVFGDGGYDWDNSAKNYTAFAQPLSITGKLDLHFPNAHLQLASGSSVGSFTSTNSTAFLYSCPGSSSFTVAGAASGGNIRVRKGASLSLAAGTGDINVKGYSRNDSTFSLTALSGGGTVFFDKTVDASTTVPGIYRIATGANGVLAVGSDLANIETGSTGVKTLVLSGTDNHIPSLAGGYEIELADAATSAHVLADMTNAPSFRLNGGTLTLAGYNVSNILNRAAFWGDASDDSSWTQYDNPATYTVAYGALSGNTYPIVNIWKDVRGDGTYCLRRVPVTNAAVYISPYRVTDDWNGPYMSLDTRAANGNSQPCRMRLYKNGDVSSMAAKLVVMVFDSSPGGGAAVLGNESGKFARAGTALSNPILPATATDCAVWLDGVAQADPTNCYFSGGWQVISIDPGSATVSGLARPDSINTNAKGGQNIAEILMFSEELADEERIRVERYLAEKWGLASSYKSGRGSGTVEARVYGAGTVQLDANATLGGVFEGTVDLGGNVLTVPASAAPTEADVAAIEGRTGWFDPSTKADVVLFNSQITKSTLYRLYDHVLGTNANAWTVFGHSTQRGACRRTDGWLDFRKGTAVNNSSAICPDGAVIRFKRYPDNITGTDIVPMPVRTVIMAQDSSAGGGTPLASKVDVSSSTLGQRISAYSSIAPGYTGDDWTVPILPDSTKAAYTDTVVYLDGISVDARTHGFNGRKEVFSSIYSTDLSLAAFGDYSKNVFTNAIGEVQGEIIGEMLMFSRALNDAERGLVEGYLMRKWCGTTLPGFGDLSGATVTGAGEVRLSTPASAPNFAAGFDGLVAVTSDTLTFNVDAEVSQNAAVDAISVPDGTISLPASVTVEVDVAAPAVNGTYELLSANAFSGPVSWTLSGTPPAGKTMRLVAGASSLSVEIMPKGVIFTIR